MTFKLNYKQEEILNKIINLLENQDLKWLKNWSCGEFKNYISKKSYKGINSFILNINNIENGFKSPYYLTFLQVKNLKGFVKSESKATPIFFYEIKKEKIKEEVIKEGIKTTTEKEIRKPILRVYYVFNIEQTNIKPIGEEKTLKTPIENAEQIILNFKDKPLIYEIKQEQAFYSPNDDKIIIPLKEDFKTIEDFYSTLYHELSHSTGHKKRLHRDTIENINYFGSLEYSKEEIIAELSDCFLCARAGIENTTLNNNTAYIKGWLKNMKEDKTFLFKVVKEAQKSADYITGEFKPTGEVLK